MWVIMVWVPFSYAPTSTIGSPGAETFIDIAKLGDEAEALYEGNPQASRSNQKGAPYRFSQAGIRPTIWS